MNSPTGAELELARRAAKLTQERAAALVYTPVRTWQDWESGRTRMTPATWELFRLKVSLLSCLTEASTVNGGPATAELDSLRNVIHEIAEEWAGAECGEPITAQEAYAIELARRMGRMAAEARDGHR